MSFHEIFLLIIVGLSILLDFRVKSRRKKRASSGKPVRPSVLEFPTVSESPVLEDDETGSELPVFEVNKTEPGLPAVDEALPQVYEPVISGSIEVPGVPELMEESIPAVQNEVAPRVKNTDSAGSEALDPKKLVIYSEIMSPKFKDF